MRYWWVHHGRNYGTAIEKGTLWVCHAADGAPAQSLEALKKMEQGDVVFHYFGPYVRAVSVVAKERHAHARPEGYERLVGEGDDGWLVRVNTVATGLCVHRDRAAKLSGRGGPGPFTESGKPVRRYVSPLSDDDGAALLAAARIDGLPSPAGSLRGRPGSVWGTGDPADSATRLEQEYLHKNLLRGRRSASCSICGEDLPARLLNAGHIKPREQSTDRERMDFEANAMLTCALGCDALYAWGCVVIDGDGTIRRGVPAETRCLEEAVNALLGRRCTAHDERTAPNFAATTRLVLG
ncbi:hypothetical protein [Arthrobacter sp. STN4]|uniref:hypothetical protein n=1 Tax=Arthrobacter sp. STN4 TaxID=2923276 RepID=UPI00211A5507|nr:hypothetical protein [Arthrobacter sp. STN4]MCQ9165171.1 hypothetical protein [Arthrobacter sp. STN4]